MIAAIELVADRAGPTPYDPSEGRGMQACLAARQHGVLLRPLGDVVVIMPPLCVTCDEIDQLCDAAEAGINEVCGR